MATTGELDRQPSVQFCDHIGAVARGDRRKSCHRYRVTRMRGANPGERLVEAIDNRQQPARVEVGNPAGHNDGVPFVGKKPPPQMLRQHVDILLENRDVAFAGLLGEPAAQCLERPDIADALLLLEKRMDAGDHVQRLRRIERRARRKLDQHVNRIGARQFDIQALARRDRPLPIRNLIGQPVSRLEVGVVHTQPDDDDKTQETVKPRSTDHRHR